MQSSVYKIDYHMSSQKQFHTHGPFFVLRGGGGVGSDLTVILSYSYVQKVAGRKT